MLAFVAAKGHSARVPRKNMRDFNGAPLFHQILTTLTDAELVTRVVLDSDSDEILESASGRFPDLELIRRPPELCGDEVPMNALIQHAFEITGADVLLQTHATNPLLKPGTIDQAITQFRHSEARSLMGVTELRTRLYTEDMAPLNHDPSELIPTQDLAPIYEENSNIYIVTRAAFDECGHRVTADAVPFPIAPLEAVDIDNESDFTLAQILASTAPSSMDAG